MTGSETRVLAVDDDGEHLDRLQALLQPHGYHARGALDARTAEVLCEVWRPHVALLELHLRDMDGITLLRRLKACRASLPVIIVTGAATVDLAVEALTAGAASLLQKPVDADKLLGLLARACPAGRPDDASAMPAVQELGGLVSQDPNMIRAFDLLRTAAPTMVNVLVLGENGTGKELAATALHDLSRRRHGPLVKINCAAIPADLLESELFGHRRGAFTGASADKKGLFEVAHRGSLLLDEIGEMPPPLQVKLLRVLQEREFRPVGATTPIRADFRLICATNVDPMEHVRRGRLRKDLYFRLNTITVELVPLRDRPADVPLVAERLLARFAAAYGRDVSGFDADAMQLLVQHAWPGNVRELEHVVERAVILGRGPRVRAADLPDAVRRPGPATFARAGLPGGCTLEELERLAILQTLELTGWNKRVTADLLGIHRPTLYNKLRKYRLWRREDRFRREPASTARRQPAHAGLRG